jgi:TAP-like protein
VRAPTLTFRPACRLRNISADTTHDIEFAGDDVAGVLFQMMYDSEMATFVPMLIDQLEHEQYDAFRNIAGLLLFYDGMSEGMQATTTCAEEAPAIPADYTVPAPTLFPIGPDVVTDDIAWTTQWCDIAAVPALDPVVNQPIKSPVPVLISSGRYDPITPAELAAVVAPWFDRAQVIVTPSGAHGAILDNACAGQIFVAFLDDPTQTLDTSCLTTQETRFATPSTISRTSAAAKALNGENPIGAWLAPGLLGFFWLLSILLLRPVSTVVRLAQGKPAPAAAVRIYHVVQFLTAAAALVYVVVLIAVLYDSAIVQNSLAFFFGIPKIPIYLTSLWGFPLLSVFYVALWVRLLAQRQQSLTGMVYTVTTVAALIGVFGALIALGVYPG